MIPLASALALLAIIAITRLLPGTLWRWSAKDSAYHLLLRREIRRAGYRMPERIPPMLLEFRQSYPWLYHALIALVPASWLARMPSLPSTVIDFIAGLFCIGAAAWLAQAAMPAVSASGAAMLSALFFATSPALLVLGIGPRAHDITPRPLGELLLTVQVLAIGVWLARGDSTSLVVAVLAGALALLASKFAAQVMLFGIPIAALVAQSPAPLLVLPLSILLALMISRGRYRDVAVAQWRHLEIYRKRLQHEHAILRDRNNWRALAASIVAMVKRPARTTIREMVRLAEHNTYLQLGIRNVLLLGLLVAVVAGRGPVWTGAAAAPGQWLLAWAVAMVVIFALTSFRGFRFFGEAERYPEYAVPAAAILAAIAVLQAPGSTGRMVLLFYGLTLIPSLGYGVARRLWNRSRTPATTHDGLIAYLGSRPTARGEVVLALPWHAAFAIAPHLEQHFLVGNDGRFWAERYDDIFVRYPWPTTDLDWWKVRHGARLALVERALLDHDQEQAPIYQLDARTMCYEDERFTVYEL